VIPRGLTLRPFDCGACGTQGRKSLVTIEVARARGPTAYRAALDEIDGDPSEGAGPETAADRISRSSP